MRLYNKAITPFRLKSHRLILIFVLLHFFLFIPISHSRDLEPTNNIESITETEINPDTEKDAKPSEEPFLERYGQKADSFQTALSNRITTSADWLDSFFQADRMEIEENKTSLRLKLSSFFEEGETYDVKLSARLRLALPGLEDKFHLYINSVFEEDDISVTDPLNEPSDVNNTEKNTDVSLRYFFKAAKKRNFSFRVGVRFDKFTPELYAGPRFSLSNGFGQWTIRFTDKLTYFTDNGWENRSDIDFERALADNLFFRTNLKGSWYEDAPGYFYSLNNTLFQTIDADRAIAYQQNTYFQTSPCNELSKVLVRVKYRSRIWRAWLFYEISPQMTFPREHDFDAIPGITVSLEGVFGKGVFE